MVNYKILFSIILILVINLNCSKDNSSPYSYEESTIYSENNKVLFKEILVDIIPYIIDSGIKKYYVSDTIKNITLRINDNSWGYYNSFALDTSIFIKQKIGLYVVTSDTLKYSAHIPYKISNPHPLTKAAEFSALLNRYITLEPGFYICRLESFEIIDINGNTKKIITNLSQPLEVKTNSISSYLGKFEVKIL